MKNIFVVLTLIFAAPGFAQFSGRGPVFPPNEGAPVKGGKVMVRLGDLQQYRREVTSRLRGNAYFGTVIVERSDLGIEEGRMIYDCYESDHANAGSLKCEDVEYIRPGRSF